MEPTLKKGEEVLLDIKDSARRRVVCGLRWDPMTEAGGGGTVARGGNASAHDLDLLCLLFDKQGRFMSAVTGEEGYRTGDSGNIYHTGDVIDGEDTLDDEQISLELFNLSSKIHQVFFVAEVQSVHTFGGVANPEIRIANAIDDRNFAHSDLGGGAGADKNAFIFGCIYRHRRGWMFRKVGDYFDGANISDWSETLKEYVVVEEGAAGGKDFAPSPSKKETVPLRYSMEARQRVVCGLNWDPNPEEQTDLDLACVMYNADGEVVDGVSAQPGEEADQSGKVYHSGDDTSGEGDRTDDEAISVELKDLPEYIHHIVFVAEIQSEHTFSDITNPSARIADGKTNDDQLLTNLGGQDGANNNACVFARISRKGESWSLTAIEEYFNGEDVADWIEHLKRYLG